MSASVSNLHIAMPHSHSSSRRSSFIFPGPANYNEPENGFKSISLDDLTVSGSRMLPGTPLNAEEEISKIKLNDALGSIYKRLQEETPDHMETWNKNSLYFRDGIRRIDYVLAYKTDEDARKAEYRIIFHSNLQEQGLQLEFEDSKEFDHHDINFVKIHARWEVLTKYAEILNIRMPIKHVKSQDTWENSPTLSSIKCLDFILKQFSVSPQLNDEVTFTAPFRRVMEDQFLIQNKDTFFSTSQRSFIVDEILKRTLYDEKDYTKFGLSRLLNNGTYVLAYPLHDGPYDRDTSDERCNERRLLYQEWANISKWYKRQPLWSVKKYFGEETAMYFAWLGFYTDMLIPPALVGLFMFIIGLFTFDAESNYQSKEICDLEKMGNATMCPVCDNICRYWKLRDSCSYSKFTYLIDNPRTVFFSVFMSFWATMFLELWKRRQAVIAWEWNLSTYEQEEENRPEFEVEVKTTRINPFTHQPEPYLPITNKLSRYLAVALVLVLFLFVVLATVFGNIVYRLLIISIIHNSKNEFIKNKSNVITSGTASLLNLVAIMILNNIYQKVSTRLTDFELPKTQTEYEDSYTMKIFVFQFINYYATLTYIAFFKGRFMTYPGDVEAREYFKHDMCDPAGCLFELCIQLSIVMVGKQAINNVKEVVVPRILNFWRRRHSWEEKLSGIDTRPRWEVDYHLGNVSHMSLTNEYLEMVIQYGFVTLFVAAFPLAPVFAFINNVIEMRLDANKFVTQLKRPMGRRAQDIGVWFGILQGITYLAVVSNAFVIAYTSEFIPRMVYKYVFSPTGSLEGYVNASLAYFNTSDYTAGIGPSLETEPNPPPVCRYKGFLNPPDSSSPYSKSEMYWFVLVVRLAFVVIFEHFVFALTIVIDYLIPDLPEHVKMHIQREISLGKEASLHHKLNEVNNTSKRNSEDEDGCIVIPTTSTRRNSDDSCVIRRVTSQRS